MINFDEIKEMGINELNGGSGITKANMFMDTNIKIMKSVLEKGCSIGEHTHKTSSEIIYIISGTAKCTLDGKEELVHKGECHYCPKGSTHSIANATNEDLVMFDVVPEQ